MIAKANTGRVQLRMGHADIEPRIGFCATLACFVSVHFPATRSLQLPSDEIGDVRIGAGTASRIKNPLERNKPPGLTAWFGF
jgi:hypothetical protein